MILVTTSDYYPQMGGLSTFTGNIEKVLKELNVDYEVFHWKKHSDIGKYDKKKLSQYFAIINIHSQFCWQSEITHPRIINFIHGSEVLMTSPNSLKRFVKGINKKSYFERLGKSYLNIFISEASLKKTHERGYAIDYSRDLILHNCIDIQDAEYIARDFNADKWTLSCIVRDVPHKNLKGTLAFCESLQKITKKEIELIVPLDTKISSKNILITKLTSHDSAERNEAYKKSQFNLLLSQDHSAIGFYEGFGLTVLEAGKFGTPSVVFSSGGLPEAVHHLATGWVLPSLHHNAIEAFVDQIDDANYLKISKKCHHHTLHSHSLAEYDRLFKCILDTSEAA